MIGNILLYAAVAFAPPLIIVLVIRGVRLARAIADRRRTPSLPYPPIERLSADLRRVHRYLTVLPSDAPAVRRRSAEQAYDTLLASACEALELEHRLQDAASHMDREIERLRVEEALRDAGLRIP